MKNKLISIASTTYFCLAFSFVSFSAEPRLDYAMMTGILTIVRMMGYAVMAFGLGMFFVSRTSGDGARLKLALKTMGVAIFMWSLLSIAKAAGFCY